MGKLFCLMGKSASGKDAIFRYLKENKALELKEIVPYTTRPMRKGEENGVGYYFVDNAAYERCAGKVKLLRAGVMIQFRENGIILRQMTVRSICLKAVLY